jgi:hypothetical protein
VSGLFQHGLSSALQPPLQHHCAGIRYWAPTPTSCVPLRWHSTTLGNAATHSPASLTPSLTSGPSSGAAGTGSAFSASCASSSGPSTLTQSYAGASSAAASLLQFSAAGSVSQQPHCEQLALGYELLKDSGCDKDNDDNDDDIERLLGGEALRTLHQASSYFPLASTYTVLPGAIAAEVYAPLISCGRRPEADLSDTAKLSSLYAELSVHGKRSGGRPCALKPRDRHHSTLWDSQGAGDEAVEGDDEAIEGGDEAAEATDRGEWSTCATVSSPPVLVGSPHRRSCSSSASRDSPKLSSSASSSDGYQLISSDEGVPTNTDTGCSEAMDEEGDEEAEGHPLLSPQLRYATASCSLDASAMLGSSPLSGRLSFSGVGVMQPFLQSSRLLATVGATGRADVLSAQQQLCGEAFFPVPTPLRDWTHEFEEALEQPLSRRGPIVEQLSEGFVAEAKRVGKQIIRERNLPLHQKTIKPVSHNMGIAGGMQRSLVPSLFVVLFLFSSCFLPFFFPSLLPSPLFSFFLSYTCSLVFSLLYVCAFVFV